MDKLTREDVMAAVDAARVQAEAIKLEGVVGAVLHGADLSGLDLSKLDLRGSNFHGADLTGANFSNADLRGSNLHGAKLKDADCNDAKLDGTNLSEACLCGARFVGATMTNVNLCGACAEGTVGLDYMIDAPSAKNLNKHAMGGKTISIGGGVLRVFGKALAGASVSGLRETHALPEDKTLIQKTIDALDVERADEVAAIKIEAETNAAVETAKRSAALKV